MLLIFYFSNKTSLKLDLKKGNLLKRELEREFVLHSNFLIKLIVFFYLSKYLYYYLVINYKINKNIINIIILILFDYFK